MKKLIVLTVVCFGLSFWSGSASALLMADIVSFDDLYAVTSLNSSAESVEAAWINSILGTTFTAAEIGALKDDNPSFQAITDSPDVDGKTGPDGYAYWLANAEGYFYVKTGNGTYKDWLFLNVPNSDWAAVLIGGSHNQVITAGTLADNDFSFTDGVIFNIQDIDSISHLGPIGGSPVPEPATMLLFGAGLIGLAGLRLRKKNN